MERVRVNPFLALAKIWNSGPEAETDNEQVEKLEKLDPRIARELKKSLTTVGNMEGKLSLEKTKNDFKNSNKVKKGQMKKNGIVQNIEKESEEKEIVD